MNSQMREYPSIMASFLSRSADNTNSSQHMYASIICDIMMRLASVSQFIRNEGNFVREYQLYSPWTIFCTKMSITFYCEIPLKDG